MKRNLLTLLGFAFATFTFAQNVTIPDANFKAYLVGNTDINMDGNTEISVAEAQAFTGSIDCSEMGISDLTGIEYFVNIKELDCGVNQLTSLDVSNNTALTYLVCGSNQLSSLDISNLTNLKILDCQDNQLTALDVSDNVALVWLWCQVNQLTTLDISNLTNLTTLECKNNQLTALDLNNNVNLSFLYCQVNQLTALDVSNLTNLDLLNCRNNQLTALNVKNGNNTNFLYFIAHSNPNLLCIEVDDVDYSTANWTDIDSQTSFSEDCVAFLTINDNASITDIVAYPNPVNDILYFSSNQPIENIIVTNMLGQQINVFVSSDKTSLDLSNLASGNYFVKVTIEGVAKMIKVVKR